MHGIAASQGFRRAAALVLIGVCSLGLPASHTTPTVSAQAQPRFRLQEATIGSVHTAMRAGQLTCRQLVQFYLNRIEAYDQQGPAINAIQYLNPAALEEADRLDAQMRTSGPAGSLHCIPTVVKDQVETSDMPTTYGSALFSGFMTGRDATIVERVKAAGGIILAKTNMGEFAAGYAGTGFGACRNPYDPERNPSGSSCGSGTAVASNFAMLGIAEDTLGSIRGPAARTSLIGIRPSVPVVSRYGMMPATPSRDTLGPVARTVRDTALLLDVIAGYDPNDPVTAASVGYVPPTYTSSLMADGLRGMRLGVIREPMAADTDPTADDFAEVRATIDQALGVMAARGTTVIDVTIPSLIDLLRQSSAGGYEPEAGINAYLAGLPNPPARTLQEIVLSADVLPARRTGLMGGVGKSTNDPGHLRELQVKDELRQAILTVMADNQVDALVYATFDHHPERIPADVMTSLRSASQRGSNRNLSPMTGYPAITVPAGYSEDGLPIAIEFMGRPFTEPTLFRLAYGYEQATLHRHPPTTTPALLGEP
jgi:amidase